MLTKVVVFNAIEMYDFKRLKLRMNLCFCLCVQDVIMSPEKDDVKNFLALFNEFIVRG